MHRGANQATGVPRQQPLVIENHRIKTRTGQANTGKFLSQLIHTGKESDIVTGLVTHLYIIVRDRACGERGLQIRIRILHRCWQNRTPYDESKYLEALRRKGSPLLKYLAEPV